jgi:hypothetical protein
MKIIGLIKKVTMEVFRYFTEGARIVAAVEWNGSSRRPLENIIKNGAKPRSEDGLMFYLESDITKRWELITFGMLIIKNNSRNYAYNLKLINSSEIFTTIATINKLLSIAPNEKIEIPVTFHQFVIEENGILADEHAGIPKYIKNRYLDIQYENEAGVKLLTKSCIDFDKTYNIYKYS